MTAVTLGAIIRGHAETKGSEAALTYPEGTLSWAELDARSNQRARLLRSLGVGQDDMVAVMLPNGCEFHEAVVGVWKAGATPCVLPSKLPGREAADVIALAQPAAIIGELPFDHEAPRIAPGVDLRGVDDAPLADVGAAHWKAVASGGSSGRPKIIVDTMPAFIDLATPPYAGLGIPADGAMLNPGPLYHNLPFLFTSFGLIAGSHVVGMARFEAEECLRLVERHRIQFVALVPTMMHRIWALPQEVRDRYDVSSLRMIWHMAAPCPEWLKRFWIEWLGPERVFEIYGGTEAGGCAITGAEWLAKPGSVGKVQPGTLRVLRPDGGEAAPGEMGEVHFPATAADKFRYLGEETAKNGEGGYWIGDLGHVDEDGYLFLADRRSDLILRGGANVYPAEVEAALDQHPLVASSAVIGLPGGDLGERVHAIVQIKPSAAADLPSIAAFVAERLAKYKRPESYEWSGTPLRDDAGKVRRSGLKRERLEWINEGRDFRVIAR